jgi:hypothetical protein
MTDSLQFVDRPFGLIRDIFHRIFHIFCSVAGGSFGLFGFAFNLVFSVARDIPKNFLSFAF